jgi:DNA-binding transcriptional ArsR family regulator
MVTYISLMDRVFKALADEHRRTLLDALAERDGQRLCELCELLPQLTRFGVMKHLDVLAGAGLVLTRRSGRDKFHYLNAVPIAEIYERWVAKYSRPFVSALAHLKADLETPERTRRAQAASSA